MDIIYKYFPELTPFQLDAFSQLAPLYQEWNARINVISRKDLGHLYERHVLHSLAIAKFIQFSPGTVVVDVGTGGGFPGIPLAIMFPETSFFLVDSIAKKIKVVAEITQELGLLNVRAEQVRAEEIDQQFDFIISRAVTAFPRFVSWVKTKVSAANKNALPNGILYLKGGDFQDELRPFAKQIQIVELSDYFEEEFFETKKLIHMRL